MEADRLMDLFGLTITRTKSMVPAPSYNYEQGWHRIVREPYSGAWQRNISDVARDSGDSFYADFACKTLIARDIAKLRVKLVENDGAGIWSETNNPAYSPVLRKPNTHQTRNQFWETWFLSKLSSGNTYALKQRDERNVVVALYVLHPRRCKPYITDDGEVYYQLRVDALSGVEKDVMVPASEIIHDRMNCLFHDLVGIPPVYAHGLAAVQGLNIQNHSVNLYANGASPGGILTAPGTIDDVTAKRLKTGWEENFGGKNFGRVAVLGDGLKYEKMALTSVEGQLIEQLRWTAEVVCSVYHVPPYKIGVGALPSYNNVQALNVEYYSQCLQALIEDAEECLDRGLGIGWGTQYGTEFDVDNLLRMDSVTQVTAEKEAVSAGIKAPNEARRRFDLKPVDGGEGPYLQQQNYSLAALAKRDALADPFGTAPKPVAASAPAPSAQPEKSIDVKPVKRLFAKKAA